MPNFLPKTFLMLSTFVVACVYALFLSPGLVLADEAPRQDKVKLLYVTIRLWPNTRWP